MSELRALRLETYIGSYILEFYFDKRGGVSSIWRIHQKIFNGVALWAYFGAKAMLSSRYRMINCKGGELHSKISIFDHHVLRRTMFKGQTDGLMYLMYSGTRVDLPLLKGFVLLWQISVIRLL